MFRMKYEAEPFAKPLYHPMHGFSQLSLVAVNKAYIVGIPYKMSYAYCLLYVEVNRG